MFHCGFDTLRHHSLSCSSPYIHPSVTAINLKLGFIRKKDFFQSSTVKCWYFLAHSEHLALFPLLRSGLETATRPLRPLQDSLLLTVLLLIGVLRSLLIKFCICDEAAFLSLRELSLMYWSSDGVVTFGLPDRALDTTDPVPAKHFRVPCTAPLQTFSLAMIKESPSLLRITIWLLTLSLSSDAVSHYHKAT